LNFDLPISPFFDHSGFLTETLPWYKIRYVL